MKRTGMPPRTSRLSPGGGPTRKAKLNPVNKARVAKRQAAYRRKLAKSRKSAGYQEAMARAGGRCEYELEMPWVWGSYGTEWHRCTVTEGLHAHHKTYSRFGGNENADDFVILCKQHHDLIESQHSHRRNGRAA